MILFEVTVCDLRMSTQIVNLKSQIATSNKAVTYEILFMHPNIKKADGINSNHTE